jgi:hypothetical protein
MGVNLGFAVGARCLGLVSSVQGNGRCVGVGVEKKDGEEKEDDTAQPSAPMTASAPTGAPERLAAAPPIRDGEEERGVSGGAKLFGLGLGVSMSGRCVGVTTAKDGKGRCLGVGLRPGDDPGDHPKGARARDPVRVAPTAGEAPDVAPAQPL